MRFAGPLPFPPRLARARRPTLRTLVAPSPGQAATTTPDVAQPSITDSVALAVGSPRVNGRVFAPHAARVRRHAAGADAPVAVTVGTRPGRPG